jgi:hypothetical protein
MWPLEYQMVTRTYLPTYLWDSSDSSDSSDSIDSFDSCDSCDCSDSSDSSNSSNLFIVTKHEKIKGLLS